ncbi:4-hydroxythreonine-4-phosphate dehydrogenase PdxA [Balneatrix alpica]|uniref:4-hydroxythreonine-4-phosphate dehydrogenase PdxA n=1 Tax=Balneatrix alpica TaxID=75684 RepID=UPI0027382F3E|nr:4-hydroxythreonine-4-phosphate dehydrogenase PdxA [Balneatrix alpica]
MPTLTTRSKPLAITCGEPAGIGPDILLQLAQQNRQQGWVAVTSAELLQQRAAQLQLPIQLRPWQAGQDSYCAAGQLSVLDIPLASPAQAGLLNPANAQAVLQTLDTAIDGCLAGDFAAMVTAPVHKGVINEAGIAFSGHTEYLQERCGVERVVMMLACPGLKVALVTTHVPLRQVADAITPSRISQVSRILQQDLQRWFGLPAPRILVAGLNPHAGEGGHLGREELDIIIPTLEQLRNEGLNLIGPLPADTLFTPKYLQNADAVLAMYHDQGLPVLKHLGFGNAVNITLGLPIIRTSVDHGTALDLAATGQADSGSLRTALAYAAEMAAMNDSI